jgi:hypothetical protein
MLPLVLLAAGALASAEPAASPAATPKPRLAVVAHGPGLDKIDPLADGIAGELMKKGYPVLSRSALIKFLAPGGVPDPLAAERARLSQADKMYLDLDLEGADKALKTIEESMSPLLGDPQSLPLLRTALERRALVMLTQGRTDAAADKLDELYRLDPEYKPDPRLLAPQYAPAFEKARKAVADAHRGTLLVESTPPGAEVWLDGRSLGAAPAKADVRSGQHVLQVRSAGCGYWGAWVGIDPDTQTRVPVSLETLGPEEAKKSLVRAIATDALPGGHARLAADVKSATGADVVALVIARPTADGPMLSAEVFTAPDAPPSHSAEGVLDDLGAKGEPLAKEIARLIEEPHPVGPSDAAVAPFQLQVKKTIAHPLDVQLNVGQLRYYGTGWRTLEDKQHDVHMRPGFVSVAGSWRVDEQRTTGVDLVATAGYYGTTTSAGSTGGTTLSLKNTFMEFGPRLELHGVHPYFFSESGVGGVYSTIRFDQPGTGVGDSVFAVSAHECLGFGWRLGDRWRAEGTWRVGIATVPFPSETKLNHVNVGGQAWMLGLGRRF